MAIASQELGKDFEQEERKMLLQETSPEVFDTEKLSKFAEEELKLKEIKKATKGLLEKYVVEYGSEEKSYYLSNNSNHDMERVYQDMLSIYEQMPKGSVPRPVEYLGDSQSVFYEEVKGKNIMEKIGQMPEEKKVALFKNIGERMKEFHSMDINRFEQSKKIPDSALENIMQTVSIKCFGIIENRDRKFNQELKALYEQIIKMEKEIKENSELVVNHGDLHPENIIQDEEGRVGLMDLTDIMISSRAKDIGGFFEQTRVMFKEKGVIVEKNKLKEYENSFLEGYNKDIDKKEIDFYRAWQLWRNAMYCGTKKDPDFNEARRELREATEIIKEISV
ncbi:MAG: phosphotransferase [Patescibacteria group bacterium]|nr:phosphotransferase [Patescibacteria group bacterium]